MPAPSKVIGTCGKCDEAEALTAFAFPQAGEAEVFRAGAEGIIWVSPGLTKATLGVKVNCSKCGAEHQLRIMLIEELQLPMGFIPVEEPTDG